MSAQFGRWNFNGEPIDPAQFERARALITPYGPDRAGTYLDSGIAIACAALQVTKESRKERQPHISPSGAVLIWDGRLDNREFLIDELGCGLPFDSADAGIVAEAWERWETKCFSRLLGDWALAIWRPSVRSLILAKDPIGTRPLYYAVDDKQAVWSTSLDPLVRLEQRALELDEEYIAGWLASFPAADRTPYAHIRAVPPSSFIQIHNRTHTIFRYWDFDPDKRIRYRSDSEYEEHFRVAFSGSVRRRLRSDGPVVAELSGGMDSSSIVCMADFILENDESARVLDTVSYYTEDEPDWSDRTYFMIVEAQRGQTGCHIDVSGSYASAFASETDEVRVAPGSRARRTTTGKQFADFMTLRPSRVLLSGTGGDEVAGGAPAPTPELADLLATFAFLELARQLKHWALETRRPWFHLFMETALRFLTVRPPKSAQPAPWFVPAFVKQYGRAFSGYQSRLHFFGTLPSFQANLAAIGGLRRQLTSTPLAINPAYEKRYPYLDRDLLEFLFAIPREQLVRPGERRSLVRRALKGIVPAEILNRRRKAFVARMPRVAIAKQWQSLAGLPSTPGETLRGIVDHQAFLTALEKIRSGEEVPVVPLLRTLGVERWLRNLNRPRQVVAGKRRAIGFGPSRRPDAFVPNP
jgi:asparagine synthase (glutamine-hydrolysing)